MLLAVVASIVLGASGFPLNGGYYPTDPEVMDRFCEVIGEAPDASVPPRDRLWFKESCHCTRDAGCGRLGSERFRKRREAAYDAWKSKQSGRGEPPPRGSSPPPRPP